MGFVKSGATSINLWAYFSFSFLSILLNIVDLVNLLSFNLIRMGGFLGQLYELICLKDLVSAKFQILKEIIIAFTFFVQHHLRY